MKYISIYIALALLAANTYSLAQEVAAAKHGRDSTYFRDIYPDTWVASDALGRTMPDYEDVGPVKNDQRRVVGIFYITWHGDDRADLPAPYAADVSRILAADPGARLDAKHPLWKTGAYHWGEPEMGYFLSKDAYVIRKDMSMLADAGVDVLVMDVTNAVRYWEEWEVLFTTMQAMKAEGNKVPRFCFWAFNGPVITVVQDLYERIYEAERFRDLWFYWDGKPLLLYNGNPKYDANGKDAKQPNLHYDPQAKSDVNHPHYGDPAYTEEFYTDYTQEVKDFFTLRTMWWGYHKWAGERFVGTEDNWSFGYDLGNEAVRLMDPDSLLSRHRGKKEQAAVTPAQHSSTLIGKSWTREQGEPTLNDQDMPEATEVPWLGKTVAHPEGYGIYFQERWDEALHADPQFLYINDWNEWTAGKYDSEAGKTQNFMRRKSPFIFIDQYNAEFNRGIQPMKGGYTDNYYMQMAQNIRRYKGVRPIPESYGIHAVAIDGDFAEWDQIDVEYRDTKADVAHRDYKGYGGLHYTNVSGRNDIVTSKVAVQRKSIAFYVETSGYLSPHTDNHWMLLLIDADQDPETGWFGYDFAVNKQVNDGSQTTLMRYDATNGDNPWSKVADLEYRYQGNQLELAIPRKILGLDTDQLSFDFKWSDNAASLEDPISLCVDGDTAPNRRFNYRYIWQKKTETK
ncbi:hypothetical protein [Parapedobacter sp.]